MKKDADTVFINTKREAWEKKSQRYHERFKESAEQENEHRGVGDPLVLADFLESSAANALREEWFAKVIVEAMQEGKGEFLKTALSLARKDKRKNEMQMNAIKSLWVVIEVDRLYASGNYKNKDEVFLEVENKNLWSWTYDAIRNQYYRARKREPEIHVEEKDGYQVISAFPAKIGMGDKLFPGRWEIKTYQSGKETEISWTIYFPQKSS